MDPASNSPDGLLFKLTLPAVPHSLPALNGALREMATLLRFEPEDIGKLELLAEEASRNTIEHAYPPGNSETFCVTLSVHMGRLVLRVEDHGIPYDPENAPVYDPEKPESAGLGFRLMRHFADELRFLNLGRQGKALEILKRLPSPGLAKWQALAAETAGEPELPEIDATTLSIRRFIPADAVQVARCAYRVYGYSYLGEHLYEPERLVEMNKNGQIVSVVAVTDDGTVVGHLALIFSSSRSVAESGQAFVMPNVRGGGLFKKMKLFLLDVGRELGLEGVYSESVTIHPYTQRGNHALGARESGILIGYVPTELEFKGINNESGGRQTAVLFWKSLKTQNEAVKVYFPFHHVSRLKAIYANLEREFEILSAPTGQSQPETSHIDMRAVQLWGMGFLRVDQGGVDLTESIHHRTRHLCRSGCEIILLDLRMDDPCAMQTVAAIEGLGYFLSGVMPAFFDGVDALRLEYLNNVEADATRIRFASEFCLDHWRYQLSNGAAVSIKGEITPES